MNSKMEEADHHRNCAGENGDCVIRDWSIWDDRIETGIRNAFNPWMNPNPNPPGPIYPDPNPNECRHCKPHEEEEFKRLGENREWMPHKDLDWKTGQYLCPRLRARAKDVRRKNHIQVFCNYCVKAAPRTAHTHTKKCPVTKFCTCPLIRSLLPCQHCYAYGDQAHTTNACPKKPPVGLSPTDAEVDINDNKIGFK